MTEWAAIEAALDGMLERRWYANHGPAAKSLEATVAAASGVAHAVAVTNPAIGLIMMAEAQALSGEVLLSALAPPRCAQSLRWAGLTPVFCDVEPDTLGLDCRSAARAIGPNTSAILATQGADPDGLAALAAEHGLTLYRDGLPGRTGPELIELECAGDDAGLACILTDDDRLAARLRNIRSSYGAGPPVAVNRTANGRVSELQAAMALHAARHGTPAAKTAPGLLFLPWGGGQVLATGEQSAWENFRSIALPIRPVVLHDGARDCAVAARIAANAVLLPTGVLQDPVFLSSAQAA